MSTDDQLVDLIKKGNVDDVVQFLDSRHLIGDHFRQHHMLWGYLHSRAFVTTAAACGHVDVMEALIARGFSANEKSLSGTLQPIHEACREGHLCVVKSLVENHNVSVSVDKGSLGINPLIILLSGGKHNIHPITQYLLKRGALESHRCPLGLPLCVVCIRNTYATPELLQLLLSYGEDVNGGGTDHPPLHAAVDSGRMEFVQILLDAGADVEIKWLSQWERVLPQRRHKRPGRNTFSGKMQLSVFMRAAINNDLPVLKVLYSRGADPDYSNNCGISALHIAAGRGLYDIARYLIVDTGVALERKDMFGETPLIHAVAEMHTHIVHLILKAGYNPKAEDLEFDKEDLEFDNKGVSKLLQEVRQLTSVPRTLEELCIFRLRHLLYRDLPHATESLPLPNTVKNLIKLAHL